MHPQTRFSWLKISWNLAMPFLIAMAVTVPALNCSFSAFAGMEESAQILEALCPVNDPVCANINNIFLDPSQRISPIARQRANTQSPRQRANRVIRSSPRRSRMAEAAIIPIPVANNASGRNTATPGVRLRIVGNNAQMDFDGSDVSGNLENPGSRVQSRGRIPPDPASCFVRFLDPARQQIMARESRGESVSLQEERRINESSWNLTLRCLYPCMTDADAETTVQCLLQHPGNDACMQAAENRARAERRYSESWLPDPATHTCPVPPRPPVDPCAPAWTGPNLQLIVPTRWDVPGADEISNSDTRNGAIVSFSRAQHYCASIGARLPTIRELVHLMHSEAVLPAAHPENTAGSTLEMFESSEVREMSRRGYEAVYRSAERGRVAIDFFQSNRCYSCGQRNNIHPNISPNTTLWSNTQYPGPGNERYNYVFATNSGSIDRLQTRDDQGQETVYSQFVCVSER